MIVLCNTSGVPVSLISNAAMRVYNGKSPIVKRDTYQEKPWEEETIKEAVGVYASGEGTNIELFRKENGEIGMRLEGKEQVMIPVNPYMAIIRGKMSDGNLSLYWRNGHVFAIRYGGRMIPKSR